MDNVWFYQYKVNFYDENEQGHLSLYTREGLLAAKNLSEAVVILEKMYGNINDILRLTAITDGVFDFQENEEENLLIDYELIKIN